ncbi:hypothetical protein Dimus_021050 [Dionaea muscipula]
MHSLRLLNSNRSPLVLLHGTFISLTQKLVLLRRNPRLPYDNTVSSRTNSTRRLAADSLASGSPCAGAKPDDALMGYIFGMERATEVAHCVWKCIVRKGDIVVDATCGNGYDTLALLKMVRDDINGGFVYGMDIQEDAVKSTSSLLDSSLDLTDREHVKLFTTCHSRMADVLPKDTYVRLVAFNLGYLPGGDKQVITMPQSTLLALEAAKEILAPGGLISVIVYVGHPGGREEFETVQTFASRLAVDDWVSSQIQLSNRPAAPVLVFLFKR